MATIQETCKCTFKRKGIRMNVPIDKVNNFTTNEGATKAIMEILGNSIKVYYNKYSMRNSILNLIITPDDRLS